jgi:hypothetical protein
MIMHRSMTIAATMATLLASLSAAEDYKPTLPAGMIAGPGTGRLLKPGDPAVIDHDPSAAGATSSDALEALLKFRLANDQVGVKELIDSGQVFALEPATPCLVIAPHLAPAPRSRTTSVQGFARGLQSAATRAGGPKPFETIEVRIQAGPLKGKALFVPVLGVASLVPDPVIAKARKDREEREEIDARQAALAISQGAAKVRKDARDKEATAKALAGRPASLLSIARNFERDGKTALAWENYRKVITDFPGTPQAREAAERIKALTGK